MTELEPAADMIMSRTLIERGGRRMAAPNRRKPRLACPVPPPDPSDPNPAPSLSGTSAMAACSLLPPDPCVHCLTVQTAILAAVQEGARAPLKIVPTVQALCHAWLIPERGTIESMTQRLETAGVLAQQEGGFHLTNEGRAHFARLMHLPVSGLSGGHMAFAVVRLACLPLLAPSSRDQAREQITCGWREGARLLTQATADQEPGALTHRLLVHQVALLDGLAGTFAPRSLSIGVR